MRVVLDSFAWINIGDLRDTDRFLLKRRLVVVPRVTSRHNADPKPIVLYQERGDSIGIPRAYYRSTIGGKASSYKDSIQEIDCLERGGDLLSDLPIIKMRPEQRSFIDEAEQRLKSGELGLILNAPTGWGKTILGIELSRRLGRQTLILVHKEQLMKQWLARIKYGDDTCKPFMPDARVGVIREDRCEYRDKDFVIGMIQSLVSRDYPPEVYRAFGTVISDEVHHNGAHEWSKVMPKFPAAHWIGLSATPTRKDRCEVVFEYHIGNILQAKVSAEDAVIPTIYVVPTEFRLIETPTFDPGKISKEVFLKIAIKNGSRNMLILENVMRAVQAGRNVIVMTDRIKHAELLRDGFDELCRRKAAPYTSGLYIGARLEKDGKKWKRIPLSQIELDEAKKAHAMFASYKMAEDAFDLPRLDTLMMATPISTPTQAVGRILRKLPDKKEPMVIDFVDQIPMCKGMYRSRRKTYEEKGWKYIEKFKKGDE